MDRLGSNGIDLFTGIGFSVANDLYDTQYREYHPGQGRWISPDPAGLTAVDPTNPQTWNRYAYVANNPLSFVDPLGLQLEFDNDGCVWDEEPSSDGTGVVDTLQGCAGGGGSPNVAGGGGTQSGGGGGGGGSSSAAGNHNCIKPTTIQKVGIALSTVVAQATGKTILAGLGFSAGAGFGRGVGAYGSLSAQIAVSPNGNAAYVLSFSAPAIIAGQDTPGVLPYVVPSTKGSGILGGSQFGFSNATDPSQLAGTSVDASGSMGDGLGIGGDFSVSTGSPYPYQFNVTLGFGLGGRGAAGAITNTAVIPICSSQGG